MNYTIYYADHRGDEQIVQCSSFEDAEKIAQWLANLYGKSRLYDGAYDRHYERQV